MITTPPSSPGTWSQPHPPSPPPPGPVHNTSPLSWDLFTIPPSPSSWDLVTTPYQPPSPPPPGVCAAPSPDYAQTPPPPTTLRDYAQAGGKHPTEMHSSLQNISTDSVNSLEII